MYTPEQLGRYIRTTRKAQGLTQENLALATGSGRRFIIDLERGKPTCQIGSVLEVLEALGVHVTLQSPIVDYNDPLSSR